MTKPLTGAAYMAWAAAMFYLAPCDEDEKFIADNAKNIVAACAQLAEERNVDHAQYTDEEINVLTLAAAHLAGLPFPRDN